MFGNDFKELFGNKIHQLISRVFMKLESQDLCILIWLWNVGKIQYPISNLFNFSSYTFPWLSEPVSFLNLTIYMVFMCWLMTFKFVWVVQATAPSIRLSNYLPNIGLESVSKLLVSHSKYLTINCVDSLKKTLILGKIEGRRRRGRQDEMALLTQWHEFEQTLGDSEGQGSPACCSPWGHTELDTT